MNKLINTLFLFGVFIAVIVVLGIAWYETADRMGPARIFNPF